MFVSFLKIFSLCSLIFFARDVGAEELYLEPVVQGNALEDIVPAEKIGDKMYIGLEALTEAMGVKNDVQTETLASDLYIRRAGHYYVEKSFLEKEFEVGLSVDYLDMRLDINADRELPITRKLAVGQRRQSIMPQRQHDSFNNYQFDNRNFSSPVMDLTLRQSYDNGREQNKNTTFYQLDTGMLVGGFDFSGTFFGDNDDENYNPSARMTLGRTFLDEPKNKLNLVSFEAGDVTGFNSTLFNNSANGRGVMASSFKNLVLSADKTIDISGPVSAGWDVELYLNDQLIAFRQSGINGRYSFSDIPVNYGLNRFKLVFYGPYGEIQTEERDYYSGTSPVKAGEFGYTFNAYQKDRYLIENNETWHNPNDKQTLDFTGYYGVNDELTLISGLSQTYNPDTYENETFGNVGLQYIWSGASWQYNTLGDLVHQRIGHHFDIQGDVKIGTVLARYDYFGDIQAPIAYYDDEFMKDIAELRLSGYLPYMSLPYYMSYVERNSVNDEKYQEVHTRISPSFKQYYNLSIENILSKTNAGNIDYILFLLQAQYDKLGLHSQVRMNVSPDSCVQSWSNQIDYRWDKNTYYQFGWEHNFRSQYSDMPDNDVFSLSAGRIFDFGGLNVGVSYDTDDNMSFMLTYNLSFGKVPGEKRVFTDARTKMSEQAAIYAKVTDENNQPVVHAKLRVSGQQNAVQTDEHGGVLISDIEPYQKTVLNIDAESIEDIALTPEFEEKKLVLRPGTVYPLEIKCTRRGGLEGFITGKDNLYDYKIILIASDGKKSEKIPERDGSFIFEDMVWGEYILEVLAPDNSVQYHQNIELNDAFMTLPEGIKI